MNDPPEAEPVERAPADEGVPATAATAAGKAIRQRTETRLGGRA